MYRIINSYALLKTVALLSCMTPGKVLNYIKLKISYYFAVLTRKPVIWGYPAGIAFEPTAYCNLDCPHCPARKTMHLRKRGFMDFRLFRQGIDNVAAHALTALLYFQGEPLLHPQFAQMAAYSAAQGIYTLSSTNAQALTQELAGKLVGSGLHELIISMDGLTQETYSTYRQGGSLKKVEQAIRLLAAEKKKQHKNYPLLHVQFLVFRHNEHEVKDFRPHALKLGANRASLKSAQLYGPNPGAWAPQNKHYGRYEQSPSGKFRRKGRLPNRCWRLWSSPVITWQGDMLPCCFDKLGTHHMGNIRRQGIKKNWRGHAYTQFRQQIFTHRASVAMCRNCTEGLRTRW